MVRRRVLALVAGAAALYLIGTWSGDGLLPKAKDIAEVKLMRTMAVDKGEENGLLLTVSGDVQKDSPDSQTRPPMILNQPALTVFGGCTRLQENSEGDPEFGHLAECVVGEEYARRGIEDLADFLERDVSMRMETKLFVVAGDTGEAALRGAASQNSAITDYLTSISKNPGLGGRNPWPYTMREYISQQEDNGVALLPALTLEDNPDFDPSDREKQPEKILKTAGFALFQEQRLTGFLTGEESQGVSLLTGNDVLDAFEITLKSGTVAGIRLIDTKCRYETRFAPDGTLEAVTLRLIVRGDLNQLTGAADPMDEETLREMEQAFCAQIHTVSQAALSRSQRENADFLHLRRELVCRYPLHATGLTEHWDTWFPNVALNVTVEGQIQRSYDIDRPAPEKEVRRGGE